MRVLYANPNCITFAAQVANKKAELEAIRFQTLGEIAGINIVIKQNIESTQRDIEAMRETARNDTSLVANSEKQVIHAHTSMHAPCTCIQTHGRMCAYTLNKHLSEPPHLARLFFMNIHVLHSLHYTISVQIVDMKADLTEQQKRHNELEQFIHILNDKVSTSVWAIHSVRSLRVCIFI